MKIYLIGNKRAAEAEKTFKETEEKLIAEGNIVINPMKVINALPAEINGSEFTVIATEMIRISDAVYLIPGHEEDLIASLERANATRQEKEIFEIKTLKV